MGSVSVTFHCNRMSEKKQEFIWLSFLKKKASQKAQIPIHGCWSLPWVLHLGGLGREEEGGRWKEGEREWEQEWEHQSKSGETIGGRAPEMVSACVILLLFEWDMLPTVMTFKMLRSLARGSISPEHGLWEFLVSSLNQLPVCVTCHQHFLATLDSCSEIINPNKLFLLQLVFWLWPFNTATEKKLI